MTRSVARGGLLLVAATVGILALAAGCHRSFRYSGTRSCSCADTGCQCAHCKGDGDSCPCRGTDPYGQEGVGEPDGRK